MVNRVLYFLRDALGDLIAIAVSLTIYYKYLTGSEKPTTPQFLSTIVLILAVLALSGLIDRLWRFRSIQTKLEALSKQSKRSTASEFFNETPSPEFFNDASVIKISGITLKRSAPNLRSVLDKALISGAKVKVILLENSDEALSQLRKRSWEKVENKHYQECINQSVTFLELIGKSKTSKGTLEIGFLPYVPSFGIWYSKSLASSIEPRLYVEIYHCHTKDAGPGFGLSPKEDKFWFDFFENQFDEMWKNCSEVKRYPQKKTTDLPLV